MTKKSYPVDILEQAQETQAAWSKIDQNMTFGQLTLVALTTDITMLTSIEYSITAMEKDLADLRNRRDAIAREAWDRVKRARAGVKSFFGDDSDQYDLMGGTRVSERKPIRKTVIVSNDGEPSA